MNIGFVLAVVFIFVQTSQTLFFSFSQGTKVSTPVLIIQLSAFSNHQDRYDALALLVGYWLGLIWASGTEANGVLQ